MEEQNMSAGSALGAFALVLILGGLAALVSTVIGSFILFYVTGQ